MANTYTQIYIHLVFAVFGRLSLIDKKWKERLYKYITGIIQDKGHKLIVINGMPDHIHILIGLNPKESLSDLVRGVKAGSSKFVNENKLAIGRFEWQKGFGAFSHSRSQMDQVINYINNQEQHHKKSTFKEEYLGLLKKFDVEFDERYLFEFSSDEVSHLTKLKK